MIDLMKHKFSTSVDVSTSKSSHLIGHFNGKNVEQQLNEKWGFSYIEFM